MSNRAIAFLDEERGGRVAISAAVAASIAFGLWLTRGTTLYVDDFAFYEIANGFDLHNLLASYNGHFVLVPQLIWVIVLKLFGADYTVLRVIQMAGVGAVGALVFALARRRARGSIAFAAALPLLFLGSSWDITMTVVGIPTTYSIVFGLAALLALDRDGRYAGAIASILLFASLACFSAGLAFLVTAAVLVLWRDDRWRRVWIVAVPALLYAVWYVAKPATYGISSTPTLANVLLIPQYAMDATASVSAGVGGVGYSYVPGANGLPAQAITTGWGPVFALGAGVLVALGLRASARARADAAPWLAGLLFLWASTAIVFIPARAPNSTRYVFPAAAIAIVLLVWAAASLRSSRAKWAILAALVVSLAGNLATMRQAGDFLRDYGAKARADLAVIELAAPHLNPAFQPTTGALAGPGGAGSQPAAYLPAVARNGSFADNLAELAAAPESSRVDADGVLAEGLGLGLRPAPSPRPGAPCRRLPPSVAGGGFRLPPGGALLRTEGPSSVALRRFADEFTIDAGRLPAGAYAALETPTDASRQPWFAEVTPPASLRVCPL